MSSSLPGPSDVGSTQPGWIRTRQRPAAANAASVDSSHTLSEETEQQQATHKQVSTSAAPSSPSSGFASSFSAFFPSSSGLQYGDVSHQQSAALGDYPLFISKRGAKPPIASVASTSPPFGFSPPSPQAASLPSLSSMRPNMQLSNISAGSSISGGLSVLQNSTASRLRRPSVLATSILANEDEEDIYRYRPGGDIEGSSPSVSRLGSVSIDGHDETAMSAVGDDIDMDLSESNHNSNAQSTINLNLPRADISQTPAMAIPGRARSHSQSSSVMASSAHLARSPSAWPNSPPRSGFTPNANPQHLLARLTSEQQQAMVASASSASSAYYMIPTPYRQAMTAGNGGDLLLGGVEEEALLETPFEAEVELNSKLSKPGNHTSGLVRSFNPLNPYSERPPANSQRPRSGEADRDMMLMDDSPQQSPAGRGGMFGAFQGLGNGSAPEKQTQPGSSLLRASKSSPALAEMNNAKIATPTALVDTSGVNTVPFPTSNPATPATPLQRSPQSQDTLSKSGHSGLRRSQSASHRPAELSALTSTRKSTSRTENASAPLTAPAMSNVFRYQRANSLSDFSQLQRKAGFGTSTLQLGASQPETPQLSGPSMSSHDEQHKDRQASGSSGSESPHTAPRVVRRAVNHKKGSLMPKSKDHLRTMAQLRLETGEFEVASEAALHRISQSSAAAPTALATPSRRNNAGAASAMPSPFAALSRRAGSGYAAESSAGLSVSGNRPTSSAGGKPPFSSQVKNRFPESVADEEEEDIDSSGSEPDYASAAEAGFDPASASDTGGNQMIGEDEDVSSNAGGEMGNGESGAYNRSAWTLRDPTLYKPPTPGGSARPAGEMDLSPSSVLGWSAAARPGKRKFNDSDRFEPYNAAFKRRAVSPASASSVSLSPLLATRELYGPAIPPPPPTLSTLGPAAQISSTMQGQGLPLANSVPPSPMVNNVGTWLNPNRSRGNSPATNNGERKAVDLSKMTLG